jgi:excinuclease ABC subunit B
VIQNVQRPALILAHNKTLAAQLYNEFKEFFPENAVEYFVSYYDYYQPEAYVPSRDLYIEKDADINEEIEKLRHSATASLFERRDVVVVSSVSCIYGLGNPETYGKLSVSVRQGQRMDRDQLLGRLVSIQYQRNDYDFVRGTFRVRGDVVEVIPAYTSEWAFRVEFFGDEVERISEISLVTGEIRGLREHIMIFAASHYVSEREVIERVVAEVEADLEKHVQEFREEGRLLEAQRLSQRTRYDMEMLREVGHCKGIENYSRYLDGRSPGEPPYTLLDYFPKDFILFVDESHVTLPQVRGMYKGDRSRKETLVEYGFRLPAAYDNRPLRYDEFLQRLNQAVFVSATPGEYELGISEQVAEQLIRPTGLVDPEVEVLPVKGQIDDLLRRIRECTEKKERVLVTTLTKKMAERLAEYLEDLDVRVKYLHSDIDTLDRVSILRELRLGEFDVLVGINLLREGLDLPEVSLVAILDADKEGFLRNETSLIQTMGRAARNVNGKVVMYADTITGSMQRAIEETRRRREIQIAYNEKHGIVPKSIHKDVGQMIEATKVAEDVARGKKGVQVDQVDKELLLERLYDQMNEAAASLEFEKAARIRDQIYALKEGSTAGRPGSKRRHR